MQVNLKVCVLVVNEDKVLLVEERAEKENTLAWNVIKGTMDHESESVFDCAIREALEEANVEVGLDKSLGTHVKYRGENKYTVYFMFTAKLVRGEASVADNDEQRARNEDIVELKWFGFEELSKLKKEDFVAEVSYLAIQKFLDKEVYPLGAISESGF